LLFEQPNSCGGSGESEGAEACEVPERTELFPQGLPPSAAGWLEREKTDLMPQNRLQFPSYWRGELGMKKTEEWLDIHMFRKQGHSIRKIAKLTGNSRNTVRRILRQKAPGKYDAAARTSRLEPFKEYVKKRYQEYALSAVRILEEIKPMGYCGSIYPLRRYLQILAEPARAAAKMTVRFETAPGEQAQVDWAYCDRFPDAQGKMISIYVFVMVLCFSRMMFIKFTTSMRLPVLLACHLEAFNFFGGWTKGLLYDNMKQVRISQSEWNPQFLDFANYYGIVPKTCRIRRARQKGKWNGLCIM